ncbi:conserved hypothetical protein [Ricinus communis]|uniref:Structural constituent of cell wall n=1 Tax=Ricinus communis TaxID=3988 RepID=B9RYB3_RICCO|nr:conserved hypothetical protein [Ricinus communis]
MARKLHFLPVIFLMVVIAIAEAKTPPEASHAKCLIKKYKHCYNLELPTPSPPSIPTPSSPSPPTSTPSTPSTPPTPTPHTPSPTPPTTPSSPSPSTPTPELSPPTPTSSSPSPSTPSTSPKTAKCRNKHYPQCYNTEHVCPRSCPGGCEVDCVTCKPVCKCDRPGAVCQDPRFIGGDGITFYFHGKKEHDFCLVSDTNLHINAHFIGKRNEKMTRDFTWVQSIAILFGNHQIFLGAQFQTSSLLAADCAVARFNSANDFNREASLQGFELPGLSCASGIDGEGVVCKR